MKMLDAFPQERLKPLLPLKVERPDESCIRDVVNAHHIVAHMLSTHSLHTSYTLTDTIILLLRERLCLLACLLADPAPR